MNIAPVAGKIVTQDPLNVIVTLEEIKAICYIDAEITDDDSMLEDEMEPAARNLCEQFLGRPLLTSTTTLWYTAQQIYCLLQQVPSVANLPLGELQAIGAISVYDIDGTPTVLANDNTMYTTSLTGSQGARVEFLQSPFTYSSTTIRNLDALGIEVTAGFGDGNTDVPEGIRQGILFLIAYWYEHREDQKMGSITPSAKAAWSPYKIQRFK
jgi:uncharacterized phiE125 gp8 family phage protein